jgi:ABC-type lipoprotein release transport system permease subunit
MRWRALAVVLTISSAVAVYVGMFTGILSLFWTRDSINQELAFADLEVRFVPEDVNNFPSLDGLADVASVEKRLLFPGTMKTPQGANLSAAMIFLETPSPRLHRLRFVEGRPFRADDPNEVVIEQSLAAYHGYRVGDEITVEVGAKSYDGRIVGIAFSPEFLVATSAPDYYVPEKGSLAVVYGNIARVTDSLGFTLVNDLLFGFEPGVDRESVKREILTRLDKLSIDQAISRERHFTYKLLQTQLVAISHFVPTMVILLLTLASIITFINFSRLIATERREIGALMAMGYERNALLRSYLEAAFVLGLLGGALGLLLSYPNRDLFARICADSMGMSVVRTLTHPPLMARGLSYGLLVTCLSAVVPVVRLFRLPLHEIMRETNRPVEKGRWGSGVTFVPSSYRYAIRNLVRQRGRALATLTSIALALGVASAYRVSVRSIDATLTRRVENERWQLAVNFLYPVYRDEVEDIQRVEGVELISPYLRHYVELEHRGAFADAVLNGVDRETKITATPLVEGREANQGKEVVLSGGLAKKLGVRAGDVVHTEVFGRTISFHVVGVTSDVVLDLATVPLSVAQEIFEWHDKVTGAHLRTEPPTQELETALLRLDFVGEVFGKRQFLTRLRGVLSVMFGVLHLASAINIFIAILFVLTSINLSILETEGEFATLKAIGYGSGALARIVFTESTVLAIGAALLSVPLGELISLYLNSHLGEAWFRVDNFLLPGEFARVVVPALVLIPLGAYPGLRHIIGMDISAVLRSRTIE